MSKDKPERIKLSTGGLKRENLNVLRLEKTYGGKASFNVIDVGTFQEKSAVKPRVDLKDDADREYYFVLNATNQGIITEQGVEYLDELKGKSITLKVEELDGSGSFAFGIRVVKVA